MTMSMPPEPLRPPGFPYAQLSVEAKAVVDVMINLLIERGHLTKLILEQGHELEPGYSRKAVIELIDIGILKLWQQGESLGWLVYNPHEGRYGFLLPPEKWKP